MPRRGGGGELGGLQGDELAAAARGLFAMPGSEVYLACASRAPLARRTMSVGTQAMGLKQQPWTLRDGCDARVRASFAELVGCAPAEVALCPSTSFAISTAARAVALRTQRDDVGLILEDQMSSNVYPWQQLQQTHGLALEAVPRPADGNWTRALLSRLAALEAAGRRVVVVAVPVYLWTDGSGPVDVAALSEVCRDPGRRTRTVLVVDGTQSLGAVPFDVRRTPVDFLAASVHKWLFGAYGLACMYAAREWQEDPELHPLVQDEHPRAHMASGDDEVPFDLALPGYPAAFQPGARRFDGGGRPNPILQPMAADGLEMVLEWGPAWVAASLAPLTARIRSRCQAELGLWAPQLHAPHFVGIGPGEEDGCGSPEEVSAWVSEAARFLKQRGVHVSARLKVLRVAPHVYTGPADADRFTDALAAFVRQRRGGRSSRL